MRALFLVALLAGCYSPNFDAGRYQCSPSGECPPEHHCAKDHFCWSNGTDPEVDSGAPNDLSTPADLAPDLARPLVPPQVTWMSSGGGSVSAGGNQLNFSIGGTSFQGTATAAGGASITFGNLCDDTFE